MHHPATSRRLVYHSLMERNDDSSSLSSFPERHVWDEPENEVPMAQTHLPSAAVVATATHDVGYYHPQPQPHPHLQPPCLPKFDTFAAGPPSLWPAQQHSSSSSSSWIGESQSLADRILQTSHDLLLFPQPLPPPPPIRRTTMSAPSEWDILRATTTTTAAAAAADLQWLTTPIEPALEFTPWPRPRTEPVTVIKIEDSDSDSGWSVNDSSEDVQSTARRAAAKKKTQTQTQAQSQHNNQTRVRRRSEPRVTKASASMAQGGYYNTFRMDRRPQAPATAATAAAAIEDQQARMLEKRIAHKLSEKSRRNRLTAAIREIQKLMPPADNDDDDNDGNEDGGGSSETLGGGVGGGGGGGGRPDFVVGGQQVSKVDVVEMAVGYIRKLKQENEAMARRMSAAVAADAEAEEPPRREQEGRDEGTT